jgi:aspartate-semialdehyde dehydrogenase
VKELESMKKIRVAILGATGTVGQRMIQMLEHHPWFEISVLAASGNSAGKAYCDAAHWQLEVPMSEQFADMRVAACEPDLECDFVLSGLPSGIARETEENFAAAGYPVISNASSHRMGKDVPLLVPEVNPSHLDALEKQRERIGGKGFIVTNPNCSTIGLVIPLAALHQRFGLEAVHVVTMQALSGAGYPGVASLDAVDNVIPNIAGGEEAEKLETEPLKILGGWTGAEFEMSRIRISAMTHRVNVRDGHLEACSVKLKQDASPEQLEAAFQNYEPSVHQLDLPSAPRPVMILEKGLDRPQPRLDRDRGGGMAVVVGSVSRCSVLDHKFRLLSHNTIRGAAGAAILNAELLYRRGWIG